MARHSRSRSRHGSRRSTSRRRHDSRRRSREHSRRSDSRRRSREHSRRRDSRHRSPDNARRKDQGDSRGNAVGANRKGKKVAVFDVQLRMEVATLIKVVRQIGDDLRDIKAGMRPFGEDVQDIKATIRAMEISTHKYDEVHKDCCLAPSPKRRRSRSPPESKDGAKEVKRRRDSEAEK